MMCNNSCANAQDSIAMADSAIAPSPTSKSGKLLVYKFDIREEIGPGIWRKTKQAIEEAEALKADRIVVYMNTYGGMVESADSIRTKLLNATIPTIVFIDNNAASAGALISIACDRIYMHTGGSIGAATVVNQDAQALPDKYQSYMRSMMRSTAEAKGRDPKIAEAMVDPYVYIPGIIDSGKVLTFTTTEAVKFGFCDGIANDIHEVLKAEGIESYDIKEYHASFIENIIGLLVNPFVSGILIMVIIGGIYFELQTPGVGFPLLAAAIAMVLYFAPLYLEGMAANWEILIFITGIILLAVEIFVLPGFGIAGVGGIVLIATSLTFSLIKNDGFDFSGVPSVNIFQPLLIVMSSMILSVILSYVLGKRFMSSNLFGKLVLQDVQDAKAGYASFDTNQQIQLIGREGTAVTHMRPTGKIKIGEDMYTATTEFSFIDNGEHVVVTRVEGMNIFVKKRTV